MKRIVCVLVLIFAAVTAAIAFAEPSGSATDFLRIHIRADSNDSADQNVKYAVKSAVVEYLTPYVAQAHSKQEAMSAIGARLSDIEEVCDGVLAANGFGYTAHAELRREQFPDRAYGDVTLKSGVYDSLIIELGSGKGNNWWCVVYPPLCFVNGESNGTNNIRYKSKLLEIIAEWKENRNK